MTARAPDASLALSGALVRLEPLTESHLDGLSAIALDPTLWAMTRKRLDTREEVQRFISEALDLRDAREAIPYAMVDIATGAIAGSTRYKTIRIPERSIEIGWTFIGAAWHGSGLNSDCKRVMINHAFGLGFERIEFRAAPANHRSHAALKKLGARNDGREGEDIVFSIAKVEWGA